MRSIKIWGIVLLLFVHQGIWANSGRFFTVTGTGIPVDLQVTLCLNAKGKISCQDETVSASNLTLLTHVPHHTYPFAGIKINSADYSFATGCTQLNNGFCMFSVSDTSPAQITIKIPDYIIIGAGTAGTVMAKKLSDDLQTSVVALHNGPNLDQDLLINRSENAIITVLSGLIGPPLYAISETIPQIFINSRVLNWINALPLGGASSVNAGAWCRGTNQVYSQWQAIGGPAWSINNILKTYIELEKYNGQTNNPAARGYNGPLPIFQPPNPSLVAIKFSQAIINALHVGYVLDYNDPNTPIGTSNQLQYTQFGADGSLRASSSIVFLNRHVMDQNGNGVNGRQLRVIFNATADNIIWNGNTAVGVRYNQKGVQKSLYASKGVIVSAGIKSSSILMRSGVGPASLLQSLNIPVVFDNPKVGQGLADQPHIVLIYTSNPNDTPSSPLLQIAGNILNALANNSLGRELIRTMGSKLMAQNGLFAQIAWLPAPGAPPGTKVRAVRIATANPIPGLVVALVDLVQPKSRGQIRIQSKNPFVAPALDLGEFNNPNDYKLYFDTFKTYIPLINTQLHALDANYQMIFPDPMILTDDQKLKSFILQEVGTNMHFQSHCRMGDVVDSQGRVIGVNNLIVADDSIVPVPMDGSPMATAYLIAANISNMLMNQ